MLSSEEVTAFSRLRVFQMFPRRCNLGSFATTLTAGNHKRITRARKSSEVLTVTLAGLTRVLHLRCVTSPRFGRRDTTLRPHLIKWSCAAQTDGAHYYFSEIAQPLVSQRRKGRTTGPLAARGLQNIALRVCTGARPAS